MLGTLRHRVLWCAAALQLRLHPDVLGPSEHHGQQHADDILPLRSGNFLRCFVFLANGNPHSFVCLPGGSQFLHHQLRPLVPLEPSGEQRLFSRLRGSVADHADQQPNGQLPSWSIAQQRCHDVHPDTKPQCVLQLPGSDWKLFHQLRRLWALVPRSQQCLCAGLFGATAGDEFPINDSQLSLGSGDQFGCQLVYANAFGNHHLQLSGSYGVLQRQHQLW